MKNATFFWPNEKNPVFEIIVERDGNILKVFRHCEHLDALIDCTSEFITRGAWVQRAQDFVRDHDWNEPEDLGDLEWVLEGLRPQ